MNLKHIFLCCLILAPGINSQAAEINVPTGYATIQAAIDAAENGDVITVEAGTFMEKLVLRNKSDLTIQGAGREQTIINGGVTTDRNDRDGAVITIYADSTLTITGVAIVGTQYSGIKTGININDATRLTNLIVRDCLIGTRIESGGEVTYDLRQGITSGYTARATVVNNEINGGDQGAIDIGPYSTVLIQGNDIFSSRVGIQYRGVIKGPILNNRLTGTPSTFSTGLDLVSTSILVQNNIIRNFATSGIRSNGVSSKPKILNNTIINNGYNGIILNDRSKPVIMNNILAGSQYGIRVAYTLLPTETLTYSYNNLFDNQSNYVTCAAGDGGISSDPQFVDSASHNYQLQATSACINSGNPDTQYNDIDGSRNNMGAFGGCDISIIPGTDNEAPTVPDNLLLDDRLFYDAEISWDAATDNTHVQGYKIYLDGVLAYTSSATHASLTGLFPEIDYEVAVTAFDAAGNESAQTATLPFSTRPLSEIDTEPPTTPSYFNMSIIDYSGYVALSLAWGTSTDNIGVTGYWINWCEEKPGQAQTCTDKWSSNTSAIFIGGSISAETIYTCYVTARDEAGNISGQTATRVVTTPEDTSPPNTPTQVQAIADSESQVTVSWQGGQDNYSVSGYKIYRDNSQVGRLYSLYPRSFSETGLTPGTTYSYEVITIDTAGLESDHSEAVSVTTPGYNLQLSHAILALQVVMGMTPNISTLSDINGDTKIGLAEVIAILKTIADQ